MSAPILPEVISKVSKLIQDENDLSNLDNIISDLSKEQSTIDSQLKIEQERHLQQIHIMISSMQSANKNLQDLKYSVGKLDELRRDNISNENNKNYQDFQVFDRSALVLKNIKEIEEVFNNISNFHQNQQMIMKLLNDEITKDENGELQYSTGDNILIVHYHLTKLRDLQDQMELMSQSSSLTDTRSIVHSLSLRLSDCIKKFDHLLSIIVDSILDFVESGNFGFLIKVVKVIQYEEREDLKVRLWNHFIEKKNNNIDNNSNLENSRQSKIKRSHERNYKENFEEMFKKSIEDRFYEMLSSKDISIFIGEQGHFYYQTISDYKIAITKCFPEEWKFFPKILEWHQNSIRKIINSILDSGEYGNQQLSQIIDLDYENKQILKQTFKISNKEIKNFRLLPEEKKKQLLNDSLKENILSTSKWMDTALDKAVNKFESLSEEPSDNRDDRLSFQVSQDVMLILSSNTKNIRTLGDASALIQYFSFFANEIMRKFQDIWVSALDKMTELWIISRITDPKIKLKMNNKSNYKINENIGYLPRYITNLSNDCLILTDALERDFDMITSGLSEINTHKLIELKQIATNHSIELGTYCLQKLSSLALQDYGPIMNDLFTKSWYKSSTIIDGVLNIIDDEYLMPFIDFSYPELLVSLFDFITDDFLLNYLKMLNFKRNFETKIIDCLERDGHKIMDILQKHDEDGSLENKMIIMDILIELISSNKDNENEFIEKWGIALSEIYDLPIDLLRIIIENKKMDKSKITFILGECSELCKQSMSGHIDQPPSIFRKFHYSPMK